VRHPRRDVRLRLLRGELRERVLRGEQGLARGVAALAGALGCDFLGAVEGGFGAGDEDVLDDRVERDITGCRFVRESL
jgi:hypothetical protein